MSIRELRLSRRLSLDEAGRQAGIERSRLSRAERAYIRLRPEEEERLAVVLGVPVAELKNIKAA